MTVYSWPEQGLVNTAVDQIQLYANKCIGAFRYSLSAPHLSFKNAVNTEFPKQMN